ncbi:MAG: class I SAM-dependent methyltransferase [Bacteroidales bacterium]|nr:class I SAM-dependent methyltransferase [Bacteroidales bacterium]
MKISNTLLEKYSQQYNYSDTYWRELGGRIKYNNISKLLDSKKIKKLAEVGAGDGSILKLIDDYNLCDEIFALEISDSAIEKISNRNLIKLVDVVKFNGYKIPFEDNFFDLVICSHVIEHVEFPRELLREIQRVSRIQIFEVPIDFSFRTSKKIQHFLSYGHINIYTPDLFKFLLLSEDFIIIKELFSMYPINLLRYINRDKKFKLFLDLIKLFLFSSFAFLRRIKPNTYTVMTKEKDSN